MRKVVMNKFTAKETIGVVLVDHIPPLTSDSQLERYFKEINDVSSVQYIAPEGESDGTPERSCWIHVSKPARTVKKINSSTISGIMPRARLMGFLVAA